MILSFIFIGGLFFGSFLNVLIDRLPKGRSVIGGRSYCDHCKKNLAWYDLVPILSFLLLKGKCRYCHNPLSLYYPVVELITGLLFAGVVFFLGRPTTNVITIVTVIYYLFIMSSLIVVFFADLKYGIIPDKIIFPMAFFSLSYLFLIHNSLFTIHMLAAVGAFAFFFFLFFITRGKGMGFGDVKFSFLMGLFLGFPSIVIAFYIAFLTGAIYGCILIVWKRKILFGTSVPFGPFLVFGTLTVFFFGEQIKQVVMRFLLPL